MGTSIARVTAARIALRLAIQGVAAGDVPAAVVSCMGAIDAERRAALVLDRNALRDCLALARKSRLARLLCGTGDLWNGTDRAHQFALLNEAARVRRAVTFAEAR